MISPELMRMARRLEEPIRRLDALLVPIAHGFRDSNGIPVGGDEEFRGRFRVLLEEARVAILEAQEAVIDGG